MTQITGSWNPGFDAVEKVVEKAQKQGQEESGDELLRLSQKEVPHDEGNLQNSGHTEWEKDDVLVGYGGQGTQYAARLHEHPNFRFQKGRKGKYLEDPLVKNLKIFINHIKETVQEALARGGIR